MKIAVLAPSLPKLTSARNTTPHAVTTLSPKPQASRMILPSSFHRSAVLPVSLTGCVKSDLAAEVPKVDRYRQNTEIHDHKRPSYGTLA